MKPESDPTQWEAWGDGDAPSALQSSLPAGWAADDDVPSAFDILDSTED
ncbi:hypothetical protein SAMN05428943_3611 [Streptomyces sp. 2314.4]|nr:hypothetical protein SAMN05428943_3611 [Streptomyces sp. 2314.4]